MTTTTGLLYHNRSEDTISKTGQAIKDSALIIFACGSRYDEYSECQLLIRAINEQTKSDSFVVRDTSVHTNARSAFGLWNAFFF